MEHKPAISFEKVADERLKSRNENAERGLTWLHCGLDTGREKGMNVRTVSVVHRNKRGE